MISKITMPKLSDTMEEGILLKWLKKEGDTIEAGEVIAEAESDKATMELEAYDEGTLKKILVPEGGKVPVGGTLAIVADADEDIEDFLAETSKQPAAQPESKEKPVSEPKPATPVKEEPASDEILISGTDRIKASPLAKKIAEERGVNLRQITGSGTGGRVIKRDIMQFSTPSSKAPGQVAETPVKVPGQKISLSTMREAIASRMTESKTTVPHFYLVMEINMKKAMEFRKSINSMQNEIKISFNDLVLKASALALAKNPFVNGSFAGDKIVLHDSIDLGFAVALEEGLITPIIRNCQSKSLGQIAKEVRQLAEKAKARKLLPEEYKGATFTVSNLGMYGIEEFSAIINPPEAAILAVGAIIEQPVVENGEIVAGHLMKVTLSCDHRIVDGAKGAIFLREFKKLLEEPIGLML